MGILSKPPDRRASPRKPLDQIEQILEVKVGSEKVKVIDISRGGLLMECGVRLALSDTRVKIVSETGTLLVPCRVLRCAVAALFKASVIYRAALAFKSPLALIDDDAAIDDRRLTTAA